MPLLEWLARQHPALVHFPIAACVLLPLPLGLRLWQGEAGWDRTIRYLAWVGVLGGAAAQVSGLLFARSGGLIPLQGWLPARPGLLRTHQVLGMAGFALGLLTLVGILKGTTGKARALTLASALLWAVAWGWAGHLGGAMVFPETSDAGLEP
ncbi:MAG TPA: DUF2231 domain-containing protein [Holophagaceae bacterium]|nr:DUF2231 domain-containing protein [Holophagaceae bacterium]